MGSYDAIVVGARCAGSPAAMLLARRGYRVLMVDRATFPSDTISTHMIHPPGVDALRKWGLLDEVIATGCPPIERYQFDLGPFAISGRPGKQDSPVSYAPRRTRLDKVLVDAAARDGVEIRESFVVEDIVVEDGTVKGIRGHAKGGQPVTERARVVIGADGLHSLVAKTMGAVQYNEKAPLECGYYSYWSGVDTGGKMEGYDRGDRAWAAWPTNDGLTLVIVSWPMAQFEANRHDIERHYLEAFDRAPAFAERIRAARREERFLGTNVPNYFRKPFGPGWALVGDAGYNKDFITAQGITDAFHDAELCANAVDDWLSGRRGYDVAMGEYQAKRDERVLPIFEYTCQFARMEPPPPDMQQLMGAIHGNQEAMDGFVQVFSGVISPATFYSPENIGRIFAAA